MNDLADLVPYGKQVITILRKAGALERVKDWMMRRTAQEVLVLGASGAGKSSFLKLMSGECPNIARIDRTTKAEPVTGKIDNSYFNMMDTPGQPGDIYRDERKRAMLTAAREDRLGIINVVSYGYHEETVKASEAVEDHRAREDFLKKRRDLEIKLLSEWTETLCGEGGSAAWLITVVTKADLWWVAGDDQPALTHYQSGPYFEALGSARRISHDVCPYSSQNQLFYNKVPMSGFYGDELRAADHARVIAKMLENAGN